MVKKYEQDVSNEELAQMVQRGFTEITDKMATKEEMNEGFERMERKFEGRFNRIEKIMGEQNGRVDKVENRVDYIENVLNLPKLD